MRFFTDIPGAFRVGILEATTTKARVLRWSALIALWVIALLTIIFSIFTFNQGFLLLGIAFILNTITFLSLSVSLIYNSATSETLKRI